jgi:hypothetical protein
MFTVNREDLSIYVTRGDMAYLKVTAKKENDDTDYTFVNGDVVRFSVCEKKNCANVLLQKDFVVAKETTEVEIILKGDDTKLGGIISKPTDFWYEVALNPEDDPHTIIGYDTEGARVFRLYPEAGGLKVGEPEAGEDSNE